MKNYATAILTGVYGLTLAFSLPPPAEAQDDAAKITGQTITATGCLTKEAKEKNEYVITGEDGKTWGLKSSMVSLNDHLNHKVIVTGKVTKNAHGTEAGDVDVSDLKMLSNTCT